MVKKKKPGRPKGSGTKKAVKKKPVNKIRKRELPDFISGRYIIVNEDHQLNWTPTGWRSISDNVDDPIVFAERRKAAAYILKYQDEIAEEQSPETAAMKDHYHNVWNVTVDGIITSTLQPSGETETPASLKKLIRDRRANMLFVVRQAKAQIRDAQKILDKFNVSMEKYGL